MLILRMRQLYTVYGLTKKDFTDCFDKWLDANYQSVNISKHKFKPSAVLKANKKIYNDEFSIFLSQSDNTLINLLRQFRE